MNELPKRVFDVAVAGLGLLVSLPVSLAIAIAVKVDDGGPVFYGQERVGRHGCLFIGWKFRTMVPDADALFGPLQAHGDDARITRVGRILRATAMDELPQLWNILKGDMSFVGCGHCGRGARRTGWAGTGPPQPCCIPTPGTSPKA